MRIISCINQKGGVGKSTSAFNIATSIAMQQPNKKVAIMDLDPQSSLTILLGFEPEDFPVSIVDVLNQETHIQNIVYKSPILDNLYIIPSHPNLSAVETNLAKEQGAYLYLADVLGDIEESIDYVIIDCPPQLSLLTISALAASTDFIVPSTAEYLSYRGLKQLMNTVAQVEEVINRDINNLGVIVTMYSARLLKEQEVYKALQENYNVVGTIKRTTQMNSSIYDGKPVVYSMPKADISKAYKSISEYILKL